MRFRGRLPSAACPQTGSAAGLRTRRVEIVPNLTREFGPPPGQRLIVKGQSLKA